MRINTGRAAAVGIIGTLVMTAIGVLVGPVMGLPAMNPAEMLGGAMGGNVLFGWVAHLMIGTILASIYAVRAVGLPGAPVLRGAIHGLAPFLAAQVMVMPMMRIPCDAAAYCRLVIPGVSAVV